MDSGRSGRGGTPGGVDGTGLPEEWTGRDSRRSGRDGTPGGVDGTGLPEEWTGRDSRRSGRDGTPGGVDGMGLPKEWTGRHEKKKPWHLFRLIKTKEPRTTGAICSHLTPRLH
ncbi:hypothetical protein PCANC_11419 [Puccinia coronata f. sp. avenae]|uniref:Uncharacterized protein n=1 Tax=Puccinia coronata f. sp. avenae TaxID=200324 RepID=A0A2N5VMD5_9BASI|nr:hypothetical protein PCASD_14253 [Puccinia coronata f. sp. avenae]PLW51169.1 hypothetical protein PCANC_11419 [Puccinia coronata f. sp. avenae]